MTEQSAANSPQQGLGMDWDGVVNQIFDMIGTDTAIVDTYGLILASRIKIFAKGKLISPLVWDLIQKRIKLAKELGVNKASTLVIETDQGNIVASFGENIYLLAIVPSNVDLSQFMPSLQRFLSTLNRTTDKSLGITLEKLDLDKEFGELLKEKNKGEREDDFPIFKSLIRHLSGK